MSTDLARKMEAIINSWKSSGKSLLAFSKTSEIPYSRLCYWNRRLNASTVKTRPATKPKPTFFPVNIVSDRKIEMTSSCALEIILENGIRIGVREGFNAQEAGRLIEVLRAC